MSTTPTPPASDDRPAGTAPTPDTAGGESEPAATPEAGPEPAAGTEPATGTAPTADGETAPGPGRPADAVEPELEYLVDPTRLRRAPRFGRIIVLGMIAGVLVAAGLALFSEPSQLSTGNLFGLLLLTCVPIGALAGAVVALLLDRRSWRRADRAPR